MSSFFSSSNPPLPENEPVCAYLAGSAERRRLQDTLHRLRSETHDIPMYIDGEAVHTERRLPIHAPHEHSHLLGHFHEGNAEHVRRAVQSALQARKDWASMDWQSRAAIFLRAAELLAGPYRMAINARTMLGQSKNAFQAEVDAACELIDFLRYNVAFMKKIYEEQPVSSPGVWNRVEYRPLEGFVFSITPFNFTSIAAKFSLRTCAYGQHSRMEASLSTNILSSSYYGSTTKSRPSQRSNQSYICGRTYCRRYYFLTSELCRPSFYW